MIKTQPDLSLFPHKVPAGQVSKPVVLCSSFPRRVKLLGIKASKRNKEPVEQEAKFSAVTGDHATSGTFHIMAITQLITTEQELGLCNMKLPNYIYITNYGHKLLGRNILQLQMNGTVSQKSTGFFPPFGKLAVFRHKNLCICFHYPFCYFHNCP